jgi:hypothetical protein
MPKPDREEFLEDDPELTGQKFCLLSFLSPEKVLADKNIFFFHKFVQNYEFSLRILSLEKFLVSTIQGINSKLDEQAAEFDKRDLSGVADICRAARVRVDTTIDSLEKYVKESQASLKESSLKEQYDDYMFKNREKLEDEFFTKNDFRTSVRGLKVRGVYATQSEAELRSKKLQRMDPLHNIYVGEIGKWLPWDPSPMDVPNQNRQKLQKDKAPIQISRESNAGDSSTNDMFSGPADLALQRKMEKQKEEKQ